MSKTKEETVQQLKESLAESARTAVEALCRHCGFAQTRL